LAPFSRKNPKLSDQFQAWSFGNSPKQADELLALVLAGKKLAPRHYISYTAGPMSPYPKLAITALF
jgi:Uncharacterized protein conserved in bacteria